MGNSTFTRKASLSSKKRRSILVLCMMVVAQLAITIHPTTTTGQVTPSAVACSQMVVPSMADPYLAGMPNGSTASIVDVAPAQSPALAPISFVAGNQISVAGVSGTVARQAGPCCPPTGAEGDINTIFIHDTGAENGISNIIAPVNSLIGVFLGPGQPNTTPAPATLDFSTPGSRNFVTLSPQLKQVFFIGDGKTSGNVTQKFVVPAGATRLFLGVMDGFQWSNNIGSYSLTICVESDPPPPAGGFDICLEDNTNSKRVFLLNSTTGAYIYCCGSAFTLTGVASLVKKGGGITFSHITPDRRVTGKVDLVSKRGTASALNQVVQFTCEIEDFNITNNTCVCQGGS